MVRTIIYCSMDTKYRESAEDTSFSSFFDTFADSWDVFLRNSTTYDCRIELEEFFTIGIHWLKVNFTMTILTTTTGLFSIFAVYINGFCKCFFVCNLRCTNVCLYFEFTKQTVNNDFQMELAHTGNDCLACFLICMSSECRIFFSKFC